MRLADKVAIVTGGASGFGEGMARRFAAEGAAVLIADIDEAGAAAVASSIRDGGGRASATRADVSRDADVAAMVGRAESDLGGLDILVNNAGITHDNRPMTEVPEPEYDRIFAVNVKAIYLAALHAVPVFRARGGGVFINIASTAGIRPRPGLVWYNGSKGAAIALSKAMAVELAPNGIRVNAICPVAGETPLLPRFMGGDTPELREKFRASVPLGRLSTPADIAGAAVYLASDEAAFITGVAFEVDGGRCI